MLLKIRFGLKMKLTSFIVIFVKVVMKLSVQILILSRNMEDLTIEWT